MARFGGLAWYQWMIVALFAGANALGTGFENGAEAFGGLITSIILFYLIVRGVGWAWGTIKSDPYEDEAAAEGST